MVPFVAMKTSNRFQFIPFACCLLIPISIGVVGGLLTAQSVSTWYTTLAKPKFNPPNWIFGPTWSLLYLLMGWASYRVWLQRKIATGINWAFAVYGLQLLLNLFWSFLFFYLQQIDFALVEIMMLLVFIIANGLVFYRIDKLAGWLFLPYLLWVSFATYLTYSISILN